MDYKIAVIPGDGIGPEIISEATKVLDTVGLKYSHNFKYTELLMGGVSIDATGVPLTDEALQSAKDSDSVLLGAVGGNVGQNNWYSLPPNLRPEAGLLAIRKGLNLFANIRPAILFNELKSACPLREDIIGDGFDFVVVRELTGGLYFGDRWTEEVEGVRTATDTLVYNEKEIARIARRAFEVARKRKKKVCSVDKANVLDSSRLWRQVTKEVAKEYPDVELTDMLVDNCAMQLVRDPGQFDVILTNNIFGDMAKGFVNTVKSFIDSKEFITKLSETMEKFEQKISKFKETCKAWYQAYDKFDIEEIKELKTPFFTKIARKISKYFKF